jgi:hypothetical protein
MRVGDVFPLGSFIDKIRHLLRPVNLGDGQSTRLAGGFNVNVADIEKPLAD